MNTDPTMVLLNRLRDESQWHIVRNVPSFAPHVRQRADGSEKYRVEEATLHDIKAKAEEVERDYGVPIRLQIGHTKPNAPQETQPEVVGFALNPRVAPWGPRGKLGFVTDHYIEKSKVNKVKKLPFRSAEYYAGRKQISAIALLAEDPELDMGYVAYDRDAECDYYHIEDSDMPDATPPVAPQIDPKILAEAVEQYLRSKTPEVPKPAPAPVQGVGVEDQLRLVREEAAVHNQRQEARILVLEEQLSAERYSRRLAESESAIKQLQAEGFVIKNQAKAIEKLAKLEPDAFKAELAEMRENYNRIPLNTPPIRLGAGDGSVAPEVTQEQMDRAVSRASREGIAFDAALAQERTK